VRAHELAIDFPSVPLDVPAMQAARMLAANDLPGLIVTDAEGHPTTILPGTDVLKMAVPRYCQDDPTLARVVDEAAADVFAHSLGDRTVAQVLPEKLRELPVVTGEATALEIAALMARSRSPLVAVVDEDGVLAGAITLDGLLDRVLAP
jgi:CBS domain-containing protein